MGTAPNQSSSKIGLSVQLAPYVASSIV